MAAKNVKHIERGSLTLEVGEFQTRNGMKEYRKIYGGNKDYREGTTGPFAITKMRAVVNHLIRGPLVNKLITVDGKLMNNLKGYIRPKYMDFTKVVNGKRGMLINEPEATVECNASISKTNRPIKETKKMENGTEYNVYDCELCNFLEEFYAADRENFYRSKDARIDKFKALIEKTEDADEKEEFQRTIDDIKKKRWDIKSFTQIGLETEYYLWIIFPEGDGWSEPYKWEIKSYHLEMLLKALEINTADGLVNAVRTNDISWHQFEIVMKKGQLTAGPKTWDGMDFVEIRKLGIVPHEKRPVDSLKTKFQNKVDMSWKKEFLKLKRYARFAARRYYGEQHTHREIQDTQNYLYSSGESAIAQAINDRVEFLTKSLATTDPTDRDVLTEAEKDNWADFKKCMRLCYEEVDMSDMSPEDIDTLRNDSGEVPTGIFIIKDIL